ncbi:MAG: hypothetical protein HY803_07120, partial [candidate division NC10 bacterium]|nr:hypothetical protein [candidate division NC10 bacterium]
MVQLLRYRRPWFQSELARLLALAACHDRAWAVNVVGRTRELLARQPVGTGASGLPTSPIVLDAPLRSVLVPVLQDEGLMTSLSVDPAEVTSSSDESALDESALLNAGKVLVGRARDDGLPEAERAVSRRGAGLVLRKLLALWSDPVAVSEAARGTPEAHAFRHLLMRREKRLQQYLEAMADLPGEAGEAYRAAGLWCRMMSGWLTSTAQPVEDLSRELDPAAPIWMRDLDLSLRLMGVSQPGSADAMSVTTVALLGPLERRAWAESLEPIELPPRRAAMSEANLVRLLTRAPPWVLDELARRTASLERTQSLDWLREAAAGVAAGEPCASGPDGYFPVEPDCRGVPGPDVRRAAYALLLPALFEWADAHYRTSRPEYDLPEVGGGLAPPVRTDLRNAYAVVEAALECYDAQSPVLGLGPLEPALSARVEWVRASTRHAVRRIAAGSDYVAVDGGSVPPGYAGTQAAVLTDLESLLGSNDQYSTCVLAGRMGDLITDLQGTVDASRIAKSRDRLHLQTAAAEASRQEAQLELEAAELQVRAEELLLEKLQILARSADRRGAAARIMVTEAEHRFKAAEYFEKAAANDASAGRLLQGLAAAQVAAQRQMVERLQTEIRNLLVAVDDTSETLAKASELEMVEIRKLTRRFNFSSISIKVAREVALGPGEPVPADLARFWRDEGVVRRISRLQHDMQSTCENKEAEARRRAKRAWWKKLADTVLSVASKVAAVCCLGGVDVYAIGKLVFRTVQSVRDGNLAQALSGVIADPAIAGVASSAGFSTELAKIKDLDTGTFGNLEEIVNNLKTAANNAGTPLADDKLRSLARDVISQAGVKIGLSTVLYERDLAQLLPRLGIKLETRPAGLDEALHSLQTQYAATFRARLEDLATRKSGVDETLGGRVRTIFDGVDLANPASFRKLEKQLLATWTEKVNDLTDLRTLLLDLRRELLGQVEEELKKRGVSASFDGLASALAADSPAKMDARSALDFLANSPLRSKVDEIVKSIEVKMAEAKALTDAFKAFPERARSVVEQTSAGNCRGTAEDVMRQHRELESAAGSLISSLQATLMRSQQELTVEVQRLAKETVMAEVEKYRAAAADARRDASGEERAAAAALVERARVEVEIADLESAAAGKGVDHQRVVIERARKLVDARKAAL